MTGRRTASNGGLYGCGNGAGGSAGEAAHVVRAIRRIIRAVDVHSKRVGRSVGLTVPQIVVLGAIRDLGETTSSALSAHASLSPPTVTTILDNLEGRGLVERVRSHVDRRVVHPRLTEAGREVLAAAPPLLQSAFMAEFEALSAARRRAIIEAFEQVAEMMQAPAAGAEPVLDIAAIPGGQPGPSSA